MPHLVAAKPEWPFYIIAFMPGLHRHAPRLAQAAG
jgi:hypothetical protein